jgi:hypothetical protein
MSLLVVFSIPIKFCVHPFVRAEPQRFLWRGAGHLHDLTMRQAGALLEFLGRMLNPNDFVGPELANHTT